MFGLLILAALAQSHRANAKVLPVTMFRVVLIVFIFLRSDSADDNHDSDDAAEAYSDHHSDASSFRTRTDRSRTPKPAAEPHPSTHHHYHQLPPRPCFVPNPNFVRHLPPYHRHQLPPRVGSYHRRPSFGPTIVRHQLSPPQSFGPTIVRPPKSPAFSAPYPPRTTHPTLAHLSPDPPIHFQDITLGNLYNHLIANYHHQFSTSTDSSSTTPVVRFPLGLLSTKPKAKPSARPKPPSTPPPPKPSARPKGPSTPPPPKPSARPKPPSTPPPPNAIPDIRFLLAPPTPTTTSSIHWINI